MKKLLLTSILTVCLVTSAQGQLFTFDDGSLPDGSGNAAVSEYMTTGYGSTVLVEDGQVGDWSTWDPDWPGIANDDDYLRCVVGTGDLEFRFEEVAISGVGGDAYVFSQISGYDFYVRGYDDTYGGNWEYPDSSALVLEQGYYAGSAGTNPFTFDLTFDSPVSLLVFSGYSGSGAHNFGIDNLMVTPVPVPGAVLLGMLGLSVAGVKLRKRA